MPPKAKFTREEVVAAALQIIREKGTNAVTAREVGARLQSSARPIFTLFSGMEEVLSEAERAAREVYNGYVAQGLKEALPFKGVGKAYIRFAVEEPALFRLLFMRTISVSVSEALPRFDDNFRAILSSVTQSYCVSEEQAYRLYRHLWIYTHGIAALCATASCKFTSEEIDGMLTEVFASLLKSIKTGGIK